MKVSVMVAAKNEEAMLADCLRSVSFAKEIVVIDDYSTDNTVKIAREFNAKVYKRKLDGFATQKNFGIEKCKNNWVFVLDADERLERELIKEIVKLKPPSSVSVYKIPRMNYIKNKWVKYGGLYPDYQARLFRKNKCHYGQQEVHETLEINGDVRKLKNNLIHFTYESYSEYLKKVKKYATLEAKWTNKRPRLLSVPKVFIVRFIAQSGFRDGIRGLVSAFLMSYYQLIIWKHTK